MRARRGFRVALVLTLLLLSGTPAPATDPAWLLGRWEMTRDPDGGPKDWLEFSPSGRVAAIKPNGQRLTGRYAATESDVELNFKVGNHSVIINLTVDTDRKLLYARSAMTGNTAVYEKRP